jgi:hypothetical protein
MTAVIRCVECGSSKVDQGADPEFVECGRCLVDVAPQVPSGFSPLTAEEIEAGFYLMPDTGAKVRRMRGYYNDNAVLS